MSANRTVVLSEKAYRNLQTFATFAGKSLDKTADKAINEWMESTGETIMEFAEMRRERRSKFTDEDMRLALEMGIALV